jgi:hypothetical protein
VGQRDEIQLSHRREAVEASDLAPETEEALLRGLNSASGSAATIRQKSYEDMSVRTSFCPTHELRSRFPASIVLPDCIISQRSMAFFKGFPSVMGKFDGLYKPFKEEQELRTTEDTTRQCNDEDLQAYLMYIATQGTHYISGVDMGCRVTWTHTVQRTDLKNVLEIVRKMGRMERCSAEAEGDVNTDIESRKSHHRRMERDAALGQQVEDAVGPVRLGADKTGASNGGGNDDDAEEENDESSDDKEEEEEEEEEDANENAFKEGKEGEGRHHARRRTGRKTTGSSESCSDVNGRTLIDLGVVNPTLRFVGGDLTLAPKQIESIRDAKLQPYLASCSDSPRVIRTRLEDSVKALFSRPEFIAHCANDHSLFLEAEELCNRQSWKARSVCAKRVLTIFNALRAELEKKGLHTISDQIFNKVNQPNPLCMKESKEHQGLAVGNIDDHPFLRAMEGDWALFSARRPCTTGLSDKDLRKGLEKMLDFTFGIQVPNTWSEAAKFRGKLFSLVRGRFC